MPTNRIATLLCLVALACGVFVTAHGQGNLLTFAYVAASASILGVRFACYRR